MSIGAIGANALFSLSLPTRAANNAANFLPSPNAEAANSAGSRSILPIAPVTPLSFETVINLQSLDEPEAPQLTAPTATELFLEEARKSPMERLREQIMAELGVSEESLAQLPPDEKRAMEDKIRKMIEEKFRQGMGVEEAGTESNAAMISVVA